MIDKLRRTLRATGSGHCLEDLHALGFKDGVSADLQTLTRSGEVTKIGKYYWLKAPCTPRKQ